MKKHVSEILQVQSTPTPWAHMILCGVGTCVPLIVGALQGHIELSVFAAIAGYLVALNDHFGELKHRLWVMTLTFLMLFVGFGLGVELRAASGWVYTLVFGGLVYSLGVFSGQGAEFEKGFLFAVVALIIGHASLPMRAGTYEAILLDIVFAYLALLIAMPLLVALHRSQPQPFRRLRESLRTPFKGPLENHIHAASYTLAALSSLAFISYFDIERGYWVTGTLLLIMKPNRTQSIYITTQRLMGTLLGVIVAEIAIYTTTEFIFLFFGALACSVAVPWAVKRNYTLVAFFATVLVILLLEMTLHQHRDTHLPWIRFQATVYGCGLSVLGTLVSETLSSQLSKSWSPGF